jgi:hypothetical protein
MDKKELMLTALQQRVGELAAGYEMQMATFRAEITILIEENDKLKEELKGEKSDA